MSAPLHTPGPWENNPCVTFHDRPDLPCVVDEHRLVVAQCWDDGHTEEECEANANLIAASPDLFEALDLYQQAIGPLTGKPLNDEQWKRLHDVFAIAHAALNKARGMGVSHG